MHTNTQSVEVQWPSGLKGGPLSEVDLQFSVPRFRPPPKSIDYAWPPWASSLFLIASKTGVQVSSLITILINIYFNINVRKGG